MSITCIYPTREPLRKPFKTLQINHWLEIEVRATDNALQEANGVRGTRSRVFQKKWNPLDFKSHLTIIQVGGHRKREKQCSIICSIHFHSPLAIQVSQAEGSPFLLEGEENEGAITVLQTKEAKQLEDTV